MRKTLDWTVPGLRAPDKVGGRDCGKKFRVTEMSAYQAQWWAVRAMLAGGKTVDLPPDALDGGMAGLATLGVKFVFSLPADDAKPLLDELLACVQYVSDAGVATAILTGDGSQIEDPQTFFKLYAKVFELHTGFSLPVGTPTSG